MESFIILHMQLKAEQIIQLLLVAEVYLSQIEIIQDQEMAVIAYLEHFAH